MSADRSAFWPRPFDAVDGLWQLHVVEQPDWELLLDLHMQLTELQAFSEDSRRAQNRLMEMVRQAPLLPAKETVSA